MDTFIIYVSAMHKSTLLKALLKLFKLKLM